jgi:hypothetical protein
MSEKISQPSRVLVAGQRNRFAVGQSIRPAKPRAARTVEGSGMAVMVKELMPLLAMLLPA